MGLGSCGGNQAETAPQTAYLDRSECTEAGILLKRLMLRFKKDEPDEAQNFWFSSESGAMIPPDASFVDLLQRAREGDQRAAEQLMRVYGPSVVRAVRRSLHHRMRPYFDSMDFVQEVWASVFAAPAEKWTCQSTGQFIRLLTTMARNKIIDAARRRLGRRQEEVREIPLEQIPESDLRQVGPSPSQHLREQEEWIAFLESQPPVYRRIFLMYREGSAPAQIAAELNISHRSVNRVLRKIIVGGS